MGAQILIHRITSLKKVVNPCIIVVNINLGPFYRP